MNVQAGPVAGRPTVSVAMATYNGARHLQEQLDSLAAQRLLPDELVVTDDRSSDGTLAILKRFAEASSFPVRVFPNDVQLGVRDNFGRALSLTRGDIVLMSDQDDVWFPEKIARLAAVFTADPAAIVVMNDKIITDEALNSSGATMLSNIRGYGSSAAQFVAGCCSAVRRSWLDFVLPIPDGIAYHDVWMLGLAHDLGIVRLVEQPLQFYRRHDANASQGPYSAGRKLTLVSRAAAELRLLLQRKKEAQLAQWAVEQRWALAKAERLDDRAGQLATLGLAEGAAQLARRLHQRASFLEQRRQMAQSGSLGRAMQGWRLWRDGGYAEFAGWKSLVKDVTLR